MAKYLDLEGLKVVWNQVKAEDAKLQQQITTNANDISGINTSIGNINTSLEGLDGHVKTLQGYFVEGVANEAAKASKDGSGNVIVDTYATKTSVNTVDGKVTTLQGYFVDGVANSADKASKDGAGNVIVDTYATKSSLDNYILKTSKGVANGVATLDENGLIPASQLPSYVDDIIEADSMSGFPTTGESSKIYVAKDTNKVYRWSGSSYVEISSSLALGETSSTAYAGDKGKANADAIDVLEGYFTEGKANEAVKATQDGNGKVIADTYATKVDLETVEGYFVDGVAKEASVADKASKDGSGNVIVDTYATKGELNGVSGDVDGLETRIETVEGYFVDGNAKYAMEASKATHDGSNNVIANTYATKTELSNHIQEYGPKVEALQGYFTEGKANEAIKATQDGAGNVITTTYATKDSVNTVSGNVTTLQGDVEGLEGRIETLEEGMSGVTAISTDEINAMFNE